MGDNKNFMVKPEYKANMEKNINSVASALEETEIKLLMDCTMTADELIAMHVRQHQLLQTIQWLNNVKNVHFPPTIVTPGNGPIGPGHNGKIIGMQ